MRDFNITRKEGEWYNAQVTDSNGNKYQNYFEHAYEANEWIYYIWENEDKQTNSDELLSNAIKNCIELDKNVVSMCMKCGQMK